MGQFPIQCKRYRRTDMPHWSKLEYLGSQPTVKKDPYLCDYLHTYPRPLTHSSNKTESVLYKFELSSDLHTLHQRNSEFTTPPSLKVHCFVRSIEMGACMWREELKIWLFKIDKLTTSIYMYHAFVLLINRIGTDIIAILVFKLELN